MKITCFIASMGGGGAEHQMCVLANMLHEKGHEVTLVTYIDIPDHYLVDKGVNRVRIDAKGSRLKKQMIISKYLLHADMDALISFREQMNFTALLPMLFRRDIPVIAGERNYTIGKPSFYLRMNMMFLYRRANWVVPNNYSQEKYIAEHAPHLKSKIKTIINYSDLEKYSPVGIPQQDKVIEIAIFARFYPQKNYKRFVQAMALLRKKTERAFRVTWYGNIKDKDENDSKGYLEMLQLIESNGLQSHIVIKPAVKDVHSEFEKYHALCLPSLYEGFSNSIAEGICSGKVMLVSDVSDNGVMVKDGYNGFLFDPKDIDSIATAFVRFILLDRGTVLTMSENSRKHALTLFDKERFVNDYLNLLLNK